MPDTSRAKNIRLADGTNVKIEYYDSVHSVTDIAREYAKAGYPDKYIVLSESQSSVQLTGGKVSEGEYERGIYISCLLRPTFFPAHAGLIGHLCAAALADALEEHTVKRIGLGWVTDIYCEGTKIGGCAIEGKLTSYSAYEYMIVTMAVRPDEYNFPPRLIDMVRRVFESADISVPHMIARTILNKFFAAYSSVRNPGKYMELYKHKFILYGKKIKYLGGDKKRSFRIADVCRETGSLLIENGDEKIEVRSPSMVVMPKKVKID